MLLDHTDTFSAHELVSDFLNNMKKEIDNSYYKNNRTIITSFGKANKHQLQEGISYLEIMQDANMSDTNIKSEVQEMLKQKKMELESDSSLYMQIEQLYTEGKIELLEYMLSLVAPKKQNTLYAQAPIDKPMGVSLSVKELFDEFISMKKMDNPDKKMTDRAYREYTDAFSDFIFALKCEDMPISELNQTHFKTFKEMLAKIPKHRTKKPDTKGKDIDALLTMNLTSDRLFSHETKRKKFTKISAALDYAVKHNYIQNNYAKGFIFSRPKIIKSRNQNPSRVSLENEDLEKLFSSPIYTSKASLTKAIEPEKYWIPLIALHGLRQNEACQLYIEDIKEENGIYYFDLNEDLDKRLKNENAFRKVPIHDFLMQLGFLDYYHAVKAAGKTRLWENLEYDEKEEKYNIGFGKWFMTYFRKHVTKDPAKVFHSFRHTASDKLEDLTITDQVPHAAISAILGHEDHEMNTTKSAYHSGFEVPLLAEVLNKVRYDIDALNKLI